MAVSVNRYLHLKCSVVPFSFMPGRARGGYLRIAMINSGVLLPAQLAHHFARIKNLSESAQCAHTSGE